MSARWALGRGFHAVAALTVGLAELAFALLLVFERFGLVLGAFGALAARGQRVAVIVRVALPRASSPRGRFRRRLIKVAVVRLVHHLGGSHNLCHNAGVLVEPLNPPLPLLQQTRDCRGQSCCRPPLNSWEGRGRAGDGALTSAAFWALRLSQGCALGGSLRLSKVVTRLA